MALLNVPTRLNLLGTDSIPTSQEKTREFLNAWVPRCVSALSSWVAIELVRQVLRYLQPNVPHDLRSRSIGDPLHRRR